MTKSTMASTCSSVVCHFDGHGSSTVQYEAHCPMQHVQGYSGSHWTPASGDYSLCITPAAARATGKQITINKYTYKAGRFDGHGDAPVRNRAHCLMEEVQGFTRNHWTPPLGKYYVQ
jgi:predicted CxxxxCH...CXXCH cytochrome family protein